MKFKIIEIKLFDDGSSEYKNIQTDELLWYDRPYIISKINYLGFFCYLVGRISKSGNGMLRRTWPHADYIKGIIYYQRESDLVAKMTKNKRHIVDKYGCSRYERIMNIVINRQRSSKLEILL